MYEVVMWMAEGSYVKSIGTGACFATYEEARRWGVAFFDGTEVKWTIVRD